MPWYLNATMTRDEDPIDFVFDEDDLIFDDLYGLPDRIIPKQHWPVKITQRTPEELIPDYTLGPYTNYILVSAAFRKAVESLEPDMHYFTPVNLKRYDGQIDTDGHFIFAPGQWTEDALVPEKSSIQPRIVRGRFRGYEKTSLFPKLTWKACVVRNLHLWSDHTLRVIMISDALYELLQERRIFGYLAMESRME